MSNLERNANFRTLFGIVVITIAMILIIGSSSFPNMALSKSSSHNNNKPSSHVPLLSNGGISGNSGIGASNLNGIHNQSSSTSLYSAPPPSASTLGGNISKGVSSSNKVVMIGFDDGWKSQITYAKPILDKYGLKASFFVVCNYVNSGDIRRMNWQDIATLQQDRMDVQSHTMDHKPLDKMSTNALIYEIAGSKQCLASHGIDSTIFGYPFNLGSNMPSVVDIVSKYYNFARTGTYPLMSLNCNGFANIKPQQTDCRTYLPDGKLTFANRYDIRSDSFFHISSGHNYAPSEMFQQFIQQVNSQVPYNNNGKINAIPIITYHDLTYNIQDYNKAGTTITVPLFDQEMQYLHDNGFKVLLLNQFGFDPTNNVFYLKNVPSSTHGTTTNAATLLN
ncbi:MAG: polysaccharide deacetylase family protein [Nitrosopumilales archaeon]|nr:polysaccharide deacetylase family protein [Nitrosopumilales archaeon]